MRKSYLLPIFLIVFIDLLGFSLILPLLPYYAETFGATPVIVGLLTASYAAAQLIGAPILGRLSDRYGRRPILLASISGTFIGFILLGTAEPAGRWFAALASHGDPPVNLVNTAIISILFISRIIDGLTGGNITVAQAYISDVTDENNRARGMGLIGAAFGLGFILGPAIGGLLSTISYAVPAFVAATLSAINLVLLAFLLPESLTPGIRARMAGRPRPNISAQALWQAINRPRVGPLLHIRFVYGLAFVIFQTVFPLYAQSFLRLEARQTGFVLTYVGVLAALVQGVGIAMLTRRFSEARLIFGGSVLMALALLAWAFAPNLAILLIVIAPLSLAGGTLNTVLNSALTQAVYSEEVGGTLGLSAALESLTRVLAPSGGGLLLGLFGAWAPGIVGAVLMAWVVLFAWRRIIQCPDPPLPARKPEPGEANLVVS